MQYLASCGFEPNVPEDGAGARYRTFLEITSWSIDTHTVACIYYSNKISPDIFFLEDSGLCRQPIWPEEHKVARDCISSHSTHQLCTDQHFFPPQICQHITSHPPSPPLLTTTKQDYLTDQLRPTPSTQDPSAHPSSSWKRCAQYAAA